MYPPVTRKEREGGVGGERQNGKNGKTRANSCACRRPGVCLYGDGESAVQTRWGEGEINVFVLRPPSYASGERRLATFSREVSRRGGWPRRRGPAPRRISAQRYCFCVQRTSVSLPPSPSPALLHPPPLLPPCRSIALVVSSRRVYAPISRLATCRCDST